MRAATIGAALFSVAGCVNAPMDPGVDVLRVTVSGVCADRAACFVGKTESICPAIETGYNQGTERCLKLTRYAYDDAVQDIVTDERVPEGFYGIVQFPARLKLENDVEIEAELTMYAGRGMCGMPAVVAFRGYGEDGGMLVETDHGLAEFISPSIEMEIDDARVLIDALSGKIIGTLTAPHDHGGVYGFQFVDPDTIYFFNKEACMTAAGPGRGLMEPVTEGCAPLTVMGSWENDRGLAPAEPGDTDIAAKALPKVAEWFGDALPQRVSRIEGTDMIVVNPVVPCT